MKRRRPRITKEELSLYRALKASRKMDREYAAIVGTDFQATQGCDLGKCIIVNVDVTAR